VPKLTLSVKMWGGNELRMSNYELRMNGG
jgi:hypothetical protein